MPNEVRMTTAAMTPRRRATAAVGLPLGNEALAALDPAGLLALHAWGMARQGDPAQK